jgi:predicted metallopeptidase
MILNEFLQYLPLDYFIDLISDYINRFIKDDNNIEADIIIHNFTHIQLYPLQFL